MKKDKGTSRVVVNELKVREGTREDAHKDTRKGIEGRSAEKSPHHSIYPIVRLRARIAGGWVDPGTGFFVSPSCVITARHVLVRADGERPDMIEVMAWTGDSWIQLPAINLAALPPQYDDDVAAIRLDGDFGSDLEMASPPKRACVAVSGYSPKNGFATIAEVDGKWLALRESGVVGMSGGPVLLAGDDGEPGRRVIGIYTGLSECPGFLGRAYAMNQAAVRDCLDAV